MYHDQQHFGHADENYEKNRRMLSRPYLTRNTHHGEEGHDLQSHHGSASTRPRDGGTSRSHGGGIYQQDEGYQRDVYRESGPHVGRGPKGYRRSDVRIAEEVNEALTLDSRLDASEIEVQVSDGEVTLTGSVTDRQAKRRAEDIAESCLGVSDVHNRLRLVA